MRGYMTAADRVMIMRLSEHWRRRQHHQQHKKVEKHPHAFSRAREVPVA
jgi:hypothetical protein